MLPPSASRAESNPCRVCQAATQFAFEGVLLGRHAVGYYQCPDCGLLQTQTPTWLEEAYADPITLADTGLLRRNRRLADATVIILRLLSGASGVFLDYAGGYGVLTRMMRDRGFDFRWQDPYCPNVFARGFEYKGEQTQAATMFEALEHFVEPELELRAALRAAPMILCSTTLIDRNALPGRDWWYYGPEHGQHITFYTVRSLEILAERLGLKLSTDGRMLHLFARRRVPGFLLRWAYVLGALGLGGLFRLGLGRLTERDSALARGTSGE